MIVISVVDIERRIFRVYTKKYEYKEYPFNSDCDITNSKLVRRYILHKINDISKNKNKYDMYVIITNTDTIDKFNDTYTVNNILTDKVNILFTFRNFKTNKHLIVS